MASPNPGLLAALLKTGRLSGVLRWKVNLTAETLKSEANIANWSSYYLNLSEAETLTDCFSLISAELNLPRLTLENFVQNLVTKAQQQKISAEQKVVLALSGWQEFEKNSSADAQNFVSMLDEVAEKLPGLVLVVDGKGEFPEIAQLTSA